MPSMLRLRFPVVSFNASTISPVAHCSFFASRSALKIAPNAFPSVMIAPKFEVTE